jgi:predicted anti-sigma-YlaC factor YlaD
MKCREIKDYLSAYLDGELDLKLMEEIKAHLGSCPSCLQESQQMSRAWEMLGSAPKIEPSADYMSRFWTKVAVQETAYERFLRGLKDSLANWRLIPVATVLSLMLILGSTGIIQQINIQYQFSQIKPDDIEMLQHIDLAQHFETIKDLDVIRDL